MLESLRGLGYSTAAALADIVDNSISAGATEVRIEFDWQDRKSCISVLDNGRGMSDSELEAAMRLGAISPLQQREAHDLGRFGMGLKTASFSQCRRLTVASVRHGIPSCLRWDLAEIASHPEDDWLLFEGPASGSAKYLDSLNSVDSGTLVLWEDLDRVVTTGCTVDDFLTLVEQVEVHLAMVFHRLLDRNLKFRLLINGRPVAPWDPFMTGQPAKPWASPATRRVETYGVVEVQCHVLPHKDRLTTAEFTSNAGPLGWTAQQGFYIYRNGRLLVAGGWLGLGRPRAWNREEIHRLARIRLDIPNTADADWKIDIRKSTARPPLALRPWLTALAEDTRERARQVFAHRGLQSPVGSAGRIEQVWRVERTKNDVHYRIEREHLSVAAVLENCGEFRPLLQAMLRLIEETVPIQRIWLDTVESKDTPRTNFDGQPPEAVTSVLAALFADSIGRKGLSSDAARSVLLTTEPFNRYPDLVAALKAPEE